jgi:hypothetical protein
MSKKQGGHTGKVHRGHIHMGDHKGKDPLVHETHHMHNKEHGMPDGFAAGDEYEGCEGGMEGGEGMASNETHCD